MKKRRTKTPTEKAKVELYDLSHTYIRERDSSQLGFIAGFCFDCGTYCEGQNFQCGHFIADSKGAITRYHPHNMHGQFSGCNMKHQQEWVKINYTQKMEDKYGREYVNKLKMMAEKTIKADLTFYQKMIELYTVGDEKAIVNYLESLV